MEQCAFIDGDSREGYDHTVVCHMDCSWTRDFNPSFRRERDKTLMQGHDHCNHRYLAEA